YCEKQPQEFGHRSAGKLFLVSNSLNVYTEQRQPGVDFASRPTTLTGSYKYEPDVNDPDEKGLVTVELRSGNKTIGSGRLELGSQGAYTSFEVPITYTDLSLRANSLRIEFSSSNRTDETRIITTNYCNKQECVSRGAALTVDNLKFTY
ncbi:MAG: PCMD domain-containing protein, partial [Muribaculaceae bacterium]|nr:PCMD domain-containing protein [Muribaculaceae bacterium]